MVIGITMRITENESYPEKRDTLSKDWYDYIERILPEAVLVPLINQPHRVIHTVETIRVNGIILSNGNDWGVAPDRDETEKFLIEYCVQRDMPLLGVCRGMQVLNIVFGGNLENNISQKSMEKHINFNHNILLRQNLFREWTGTDQIVINSFHNQGVMISGLAKDFIVFAQTPSGVIEGFYHRNKPIIGIQWHPERPNPSAVFDKKIITSLFKDGIFW